MTSPIERMIEAACGVPASFRNVNGHDADNDWLIIFCAKCGRFDALERHPEIDPPKATLLDLACPLHFRDGEESFYYDAHGRELGPKDWPTTKGATDDAG